MCPLYIDGKYFLRVAAQTQSTQFWIGSQQRRMSSTSTTNNNTFINTSNSNNNVKIINDNNINSSSIIDAPTETNSNKEVLSDNNASSIILKSANFNASDSNNYDANSYANGNDDGEEDNNKFINRQLYYISRSFSSDINSSSPTKISQHMNHSFSTDSSSSSSDSSRFLNLVRIASDEILCNSKDHYNILSNYTTDVNTYDHHSLSHIISFDQVPLEFHHIDLPTVKSSSNVSSCNTHDMDINNNHDMNINSHDVNIITEVPKHINYTLSSPHHNKKRQRSLNSSSATYYEDLSQSSTDQQKSCDS